MNSSSPPTSEWTTVHRGPRQRTHTTAPSHSAVISYRSVPSHHPPASRPSSTSTAPLHRQLATVRSQLCSSVWWPRTVALLRHAFAHSNPLPFVHCLGLGSPTTTVSSRHQLAALIELASIFAVPRSTVADPVLTTDDATALHPLHVDVVPACPVDDIRLPHGPGLLFLPHCDRKLNDKVIHQLVQRPSASRPVLLANVLSRYRGGLIEQLVNTKRLIERPCPDANLSSRELAFNDLCVITIEDHHSNT